MLTVVVCVGSSCYVRGSDKIAETFSQLIAKENLVGEVELQGALCTEHCSMGVSVQVGHRVYRQVTPEKAETFFYHEVMPHVREEARP
jgi:NADH:ubiquinone oxidoreductase subunit E